MKTDLQLSVQIFAGLGLFFVGLKLLSSNLKGLAGRQFRLLVSRVSGHPLAAVAGGMAAGLVTQSGRVTSYLLGGLVQAGLLEPRGALPMVLWSNFGCTLIVFAAVLPMHEAILLLVGWAGVSLAFNYPPKWQAANGALFGAALLLFGLNLMTEAAGGFAQHAWFVSLATMVSDSLWLDFLFGVALTLLVQSHMAIILITLAMTRGGLFGYDEAVVIIYGSHVGSSLITYFLGASFRGAARQVVMAQVTYNLIGVAVCVPLFFGEELLGAHWLQDLLTSFIAAPDHQAAAVALLFNLGTPLGLTLALGPWSRWLARHWPPSEHETLARPQFLQDQALQEPQTALVLVEKEQQRLLDWLPGHLEAARAPAAAPRQAHHDAFAEVDLQLRHYFAALLHQALPLATTERVLNLQNRQEHLRTLEAATWELCQALRAPGADGRDTVADLGRRLLEGFDAQLLTLASVLRDGRDAEELALLRAMTSDRGEAMENLRRACFADGAASTPAERLRLLHFTNLFERGAWAMNRYAELIAADRLRRNGVGAKNSA